MKVNPVLIVPSSAAPISVPASVPRPPVIAVPPTTTAATAAVPRAMLETLVVISALASSISSRTSTVTRSETSVTVVAKLSG